MESGKDRWKLDIYQEDSIPLLLNLINIPKQIFELEQILFPRMGQFYLNTQSEKRFRNCTRLVLANLLLAAQRKKHLFYARTSNSYRRIFACKENRSFATLTTIRSVMGQLENLELIEQFLGFQTYGEIEGKRTRVRIRKAFLNYIDLNDILVPQIKQPDYKESFIVLKDKNKNPTSYSRRDRVVRQMEKDVVKINNYYINSNITLELPIKDILSTPLLSDIYNNLISNGTLLTSKVSIKGNNNQRINGYKYNNNILYNTIYLNTIPGCGAINYCNNLKKLPMESILVFHIDNTLVRRVFNETLINGGRFYGPLYQNVNKHLRKYIYIDGEEAVELDYSGLHLRILYNTMKLECPDNPYGNLKGHLKDVFKTVCFIGLNASDEDVAVRAIVKNLREKHGHYIKYEGAQKLLDTFKDMHKPIAKSFHCGIGTKLQWIDSNIMNRILLRLVDNDITGLPIHDSVIVKKKHKDFLESFMIEEYEKDFKFKPIVK